MKSLLPFFVVIARLMVLLTCTAPLLHAQTSVQQMQKVENGLRPNATIIFADSAVKQYNIQQRMSYYGAPSVSIAIIHNGKLAAARAYGWADDSAKRKADIYTVYQAASISKTVNAVGVLLMVQAGKLSLDTDIRSYLKSWKLPENAFSKDKPITLKNLLSHTAGLSTRGFKGYAKGENLPTINQMLDGTQPANNEAVTPILRPATQYQYSGGGILVSKKILLDMVTTDYTNFMDRQVLKPLRMANSTFAQPLPARINNFAIAYDLNGKAMPGQYAVYPEQAPDGLWTTPSDYAKFIISIQQSLLARGGLLNQPLALAMLSPVLSGSDAGLGTFIMERGGEKYFWHLGANMGYRSIYYANCTTGDGVVVMINSDNDQILDEIVNSVAVAYNWNGFYAPQLRKLVKLPQATAMIYIGQYRAAQPAVTIKIRQKNGTLELSARGDDNFEKVYFTSQSSFFLMSAPDTYGSFISDSAGKVLELKVMQGNKVLFMAKKLF